MQRLARWTLLLGEQRLIVSKVKWLEGQRKKKLWAGKGVAWSHLWRLLHICLNCGMPLDTHCHRNSDMKTKYCPNIVYMAHKLWTIRVSGGPCTLHFGNMWLSYHFAKCIKVWHRLIVILLHRWSLSKLFPPKKNLFFTAGHIHYTWTLFEYHTTMPKCVLSGT